MSNDKTKRKIVMICRTDKQVFKISRRNEPTIRHGWNDGTYGPERDVSAHYYRRSERYKIDG